MTTAATGCFATIKETVRSMLSECAAFQTWVGESTSSAAKSHIYLDYVPLQEMTADSDTLAHIVSIRPLAIVSLDLAAGFLIDRRNVTSGTIRIELEQNTPSSTKYDFEEAERLFENTVGAIVLSGDESNPGLFELMQLDTYTHVESISVGEFARTIEDAYEMMGDAQFATMTIAWGVSQ